MTEPRTLELLEAAISDLYSLDSMLWVISSAQEILIALRERLQWRDIATAPKTPNLNIGAYDFLGWCPDPDALHGGDRRVCWWEPGMKKWWGDRDLEDHPTRWMPLPDAPAETEGQKS